MQDHEFQHLYDQIQEFTDKQGNAALYQLHQRHQVIILFVEKHKNKQVSFPWP